MARAAKSKPLPAVEPAPPAVSTRLTFRGVHLDVFNDTTENIYLEGARRSGKTWLVCAKILDWCVRYPGIEWLACRYSNEETKTKIRPVLQDIAELQGVEIVWHPDENAFWCPERLGKVSKIYCYGLKTQDARERLAKIRGLKIACVFVDQTEELPRDIAEELIFAKRQPGYPHQLIYTPNPVTEDSFLSDMFPEDNSIPTRKYFHVGIYDNAHNIPDKDIREIETLYPSTHAKYKSLVLGLRGPNIVGFSVYERMFDRARNVGLAEYDESRPILEAFQYGEHHPAWVAAQRTYRGGLRILGAMLGKRMFLEDFLPLVLKQRREWFGPFAVYKTCCDPPPDLGTTRYTNLNALRDNALVPVWTPNANAPDVREAVIQDLAALMRKDPKEGFTLSADPARFLMASQEIIKQSKFVIEGLESAYVWDEHKISVGNKRVRQPKADEWTDGAQRCIENLWLNFGVHQPSDFAKDRARDVAQSTQPWKPRSIWT